MSNRADTARAAADRLEAASTLPPAVVGFDGFIDSIRDVVDFRRDMSPGGYEPLGTMQALADRIGAAAGKSMNLELVQREMRWGGNGPILAGALGKLGVPVTFIGAVGQGTDLASVHPLYYAFAARCSRIIPIAEPGRTYALEFSDGKVMLNEPKNVQEVTWNRVLERTGGETALIELCADASLFAIVNWSLLGGVEEILRGLRDRILPQLPPNDVPRRIFIDLSDPAKRSDDDLRRLLTLLASLNTLADVTLGLNLAEAQRIASVARSGAFARAAETATPDDLAAAARILRNDLELTCIVIHRRSGAGAACGPSRGPTVQGAKSASFDAPFVQRPRISTGAGDHFNGGFALGHLLQAPLEECLALGSAVAGYYVRKRFSPAHPQLLEFLRRLPPPEPGGIA